MADKPLTPFQARFVSEYLIDLNATQAYIRAGYKARGRSAENSASRLLGHVGVAAAIAEGQAKRLARTEVTQDYVIKTLVEVVERCMQRAPVLNSAGEQVKQDGKDVWRFDAKGATGAVVKLGEHLGMFEQKHKHEHSGPGGGPIPHDVFTLTPDDIIAARGLVGVAFGGLLPDGGSEPVDPASGEARRQLAG